MRREPIANSVPSSCAVVMCALLTLAVSAYGQGVTVVKGFKVDMAFYPSPHESQAKTHLEGGTAKPLGGNQYALTNMTLQTFRETGETELIAKAPECLYDQSQKTASSPGRLHVETGDGKFSIEGEGFLWQQTNSSLFISNHVHTVVQPDLLETPGAKGRTSASATEAAGSSQAKDAAAGLPRQSEATAGIDIFSDQFEYSRNSGLAIYRSNVSVTGTNLALTSGTLTVKLPVSEPEKPAALESLTAEQDAVVDYTLVQEQGSSPRKIHATGERGDYSAQTGLLRMSGHPAWQAEQREGRGDELFVDRTNQIFTVTGEAWLKMAGQSLSEAGFVPLHDLNAATPAATTNQSVEIRCDQYEVHTNWAVFRQDVRATNYLGEQARSTMTCSLMTTTFGGSNQLERLVAETNVVIEQEDKRLTGARAIYTGTNDLLELTGDPSWQAGPRNGRGELVQVDGHRNEMVVRQNAYMRLPASELGQPGAVGTASTPKPAAHPGTNEFAEIFCADYVLRTNTAVYRGGVDFRHPRMDMKCEKLTANLGPTGEESKTMVAEQAVIFDLRDETGSTKTIHGAGEKAVYNYRVIGSLTNDVLRLTGAPAFLQTTNGNATNNLIILDNLNHKVVMPGDYRIHHSAVGTNAFLMRTNRFSK